MRGETAVRQCTKCRETKETQIALNSRSSSLAQEPEESIQVNRVKSIREMFLAKSDTTTRNGPRRQHRPHSDMSDYQAESSDSGGNQIGRAHV